MWNGTPTWTPTSTLSLTKSQISDFGTYQAPITDGTNLTFAGTTLNVDDPFSLTKLTVTNASSTAFSTSYASSTSAYWGSMTVNNTINWGTNSGLWVSYGGATSPVATSSNGLGLDLFPSFTYGTTTWNGTTTKALGVAPFAETWFSVQCFTDAGTLWLEFGDGTNWTTGLINASTTAGTYTFSTNNVFTAGEKRYFRAGTPATSPTYLSCTIRKR
jgi:hypothetical protein